MGKNYLGLGRGDIGGMGMKKAGAANVNTSKISDQVVGTGSAGMGMTKVSGSGINKGGKGTSATGGGCPQNACCEKCLTKVSSDTLANKAKRSK